MSLLSGGVYKHPKASKIDVGKALIRGLVGTNTSAASGGTTKENLSAGAPLLDFAWDEDVFRKAWRELGLRAGEGEEAEAEKAAVEEERRVDPGDGKEYTLEEYRLRWKRSWTDSQIEAYWRDECGQATAARAPRRWVSRGTAR
mmetsp:Transcript_66595/g.149536  ORF Transcript_66595/g.149536 Transcript_66595/m.149536 type:complete len:144 (+) Transcript_66595:96-527(+)